MGVTWLSFSSLFGWGVGGMACFFRVSCQTLRFIVWCKAWDVLFRTCPMMISTQIRFFWRRVLPSGVDFPCPSSEGDSWGGVWCPTLGTEIRVKFEGRVRCNSVRIPRSHSSLPVRFFQIRRSLYEVGCGSIVLHLCFAEWLEFIVRPRVTIHPMTKPHNPCPQGEEFSCPNIRGWMCGWSVKCVPGGRFRSDSRMIGRIIVVHYCWTQVGLRFFAFFQRVWHDCCWLVICWVRLLVVWLVSSV